MVRSREWGCRGLYKKVSSFREWFRRNYFTVEEVAEVLGVSRACIWQWRHRGKVKGVRLGRRVYLHRQDVAAVMRQLNGVDVVLDEVLEKFRRSSRVMTLPDDFVTTWKVMKDRSYIFD